MKTIKICLVLMIIMPTIYFSVTKFLDTSKLHNIVDVFSVPHLKVSSLPALSHDIIHPRLPVHSILNNSYSPNTVFYVWCGKRQFEFQHYLSVLSVAYYLRPDNILFFYDVAPVVDSNSYNTWFQELREKYAFFHGHQLSDKEYGCVKSATPNMTFVYEVLTRRGGVYIHEMTLVSHLQVRHRLNNIVNALDERTGTGLMMTHRGYPGNGSDLKNESTTSRTFSCVNVSQFNSGQEVAECVSQTSSIFPRDIWELDTTFGRLVRTIFYGTPALRRPVATYDELIPNIGHVVWIGGGEMTFLFYLCLLSLVHVVEVDMVYIHGDGPPRGKYWDLVKQNPKVQLIYRDRPDHIFGNDIKGASHISDSWRVDFMIKYGGIYIDTDAVFVKPLDRAIRGYDAVGSYDWPQWNSPFPDIINFGIAIGKRNAPYWQKFQESMRDFKDGDWTWNGLRQPYKIQERHPDLVLIDPHLQVICYQSLCHPTWWPDYHNGNIHHLNSPSIKNWREDAYAFHWTEPTPHELQSYKTMLQTNSTFSQIGMYIVEKSGMMTYFIKLVQEEKQMNKTKGL